MFSSLSSCTPASLVTTQYRSESIHELDIDANVTIQVNGTIRSERPIQVFPTDLVKAQIVSPNTYLGYAFYEYTINNIPSAFAVVNRNNYNPTVKIKDSKLKWFNYLNLQPEITFYQSRLQFPTLRLVGWASNFIDVEDLHIILDPLNDSLNFFSKNQELVCKVVLPAGPIDYKRIVRSTPVGTYRQDLIVLGNNYKLYKILFDRRYYESQEFKPAILPFFNLDDLPFQQDLPAGGSFLDLARKKFLSKLFPVIMALDTDGNNLWIAGSDKVYLLDANFSLLTTFTVPSEEINSITCWLNGVAVTTKSHKLLHVSSSGSIQLYVSSMLGSPAVLDNKLIIPDSNNQRLLVFSDLSGAYTQWSTPDFIPAYAKNFRDVLYVTGHDNISVLKYSAPDVYSKITFERKVTLVSVVDESIIAIHYLQDYTTLDTTGIRQIAPIKFENRKGGITHIGTKPVQVYMLGEPGIIPVAGPNMVVWVNGLKNEPIGFKDYVSVSYKALTVGIMRSAVVIGDQAVDYTVEVESPKTFTDNFSNGQYNLNLISAPYNSNLTVTTGNIDNGTTVIPMPFTFRMYGQTYSTVNVGTNGYITFGTDLQTNVVPVSTRLTTPAVYAERDDLYQGLPIVNVNPLSITSGTLTTGETPGVFWKTQEYIDTTEFRIKWVGTAKRFFPFGNTIPMAASIVSTTQLPMGRFTNFYVNDYLSGGNISVTTRVIAKTFINNIAKIRFVDTINNRYYLRSDRSVSNHTEIWSSNSYYGYVSSTLTTTNLGPVILSRASLRHFILDTHVASSFANLSTMIKCESVAIGNYHFITNPVSVVENTKTFSALRSVNTNRIYVNYVDTLNLYPNSTLYSTGPLPADTRLVGAFSVLRKLSVVKSVLPLAGNLTQLNFNVNLINFESPVDLKYQLTGFSGNLEYFNNQPLSGSQTLTSNTTISFTANSIVEVGVQTFSIEISANLIANVESTVSFTHNIIAGNILEPVSAQTLDSSFTEHYLSLNKVITSDTINTYSFKNTEVVFSIDANHIDDIQLINGTGAVYFVENYVTVANAAVSLNTNDVANFTGNFAVVNQPCTLNLNDLITFKANVPSPTVSYEVGFYYSPLFQYIEINYPSNTNHITANVGIGGTGNANVILPTTVSNTSYLFASYTRIGSWQYLGQGSFVEKIKEYNPRLPQVMRFSTPDTTSLRYEFVIEHKIQSNSNVLLATDYGYLEHNGIFYNGFGTVSRIKENDLVVLTIPFNTTKRSIAPMISIGDFQFALPSAPELLYDSVIRTTVIYSNQPLATYVTGNITVTYSGDYFIPDYYVGPPGYKNNIVFKRTRSGSTTVLTGQSHFFINGDVITAEKVRTSTRKYDYRDVVITGPESLRIAFRTSSDPLFNELNYDLLDQPFVRAHDFYQVEGFLGLTEVPSYRTANITVTSNAGSITSNLYVDTPGVNFIHNGNLLTATNYLTQISTGSNIALIRLLSNYFESNVIVYQVQADYDLSNVYIPIGSWPIRNKTIQLDAIKDSINYSSTSIDGFLKENTTVSSYLLEKNFYEGGTKVLFNVEPESVFSTTLIGGVITQEFIDEVTSVYVSILNEFLTIPTTITRDITDGLLVTHGFNITKEIKEAEFVQSHEFNYLVDDPDAPLTYTIFGGSVKESKFVQSHEFNYLVDDPDAPLTYTIFGGSVKESKFVQSHEFKYTINDPDAPLTYTIFGGSVKEAEFMQSYEFKYLVDDPDAPLTYTIFGGSITEAIPLWYTQFVDSIDKVEVLQYTKTESENLPKYLESSTEVKSYSDSDSIQPSSLSNFSASPKNLSKFNALFFDTQAKNLTAGSLSKFSQQVKFIATNTKLDFTFFFYNLANTIGFRSPLFDAESMRIFNFINYERFNDIIKYYNILYFGHLPGQFDRINNIIVDNEKLAQTNNAYVAFESQAKILEKFIDYLELVEFSMFSTKTDLLEDMYFNISSRKDSITTNWNYLVPKLFSEIFVDRDFMTYLGVSEPEIDRDFITYPGVTNSDQQFDFTVSEKSIGVEIQDPFITLPNSTDLGFSGDFKTTDNVDSLLVDFEFKNLQSTSSLLVDLTFKSLQSVDSLTFGVDLGLIEFLDRFYKNDFAFMADSTDLYNPNHAKFAAFPTSTVLGGIMELQQSTDSVTFETDWKNLNGSPNIFIDMGIDLHFSLDKIFFDNDFEFQNLPTSHYKNLDFRKILNSDSVIRNMKFGFQEFPTDIINDLIFLVNENIPSFILDNDFTQYELNNVILNSEFTVYALPTDIDFNFDFRFPDDNSIVFNYEILLPDDNPIVFGSEFLVPSSDPAVSFDSEFIVENNDPPATFNINPMHLTENLDSLTFDSIFDYISSQSSVTRNSEAFWKFFSDSLTRDLSVYFYPSGTDYLGILDFDFVNNNPTLTKLLEMKFIDSTPSISGLLDFYYVDNLPSIQSDISSTYVDSTPVMSGPLSGSYTPYSIMGKIKFDYEMFGPHEINNKMVFFEIPPHDIVRTLSPEFDQEQAWTYAERNQFGSKQSDIYFFATNKVWSRYEKDVSISAVATQGNVLYIEPPNGYIIKSVEFASYGLPRGNPGQFIVNPSAHAPDSLEIIKGILLGSAGNIAIPVTDVIFGNIAPGVTKQLAITATAVPQNRYKMQTYPTLSNKGIVSVYDDQVIHYFTSNDTMTFSSNSAVNVEVLVVGGGGGGGGGEIGTGNTQRGGGGGAGGLVVAKFTVNPGTTMNIFVGGGGKGGSHGAGAAGGLGGSNGGGNGGAAGIQGTSGSGGGGGGWSGISINGNYMVVAGGGAGGGGAFEGIANDLPASGGGNQIGGQNTGTMNGGIGTSFAGIGIAGLGTRIFSLKDAGLAGPPNYTAYEPNYGDFLIEQGVWEVEPGEPNFVRTYTVNFPTSGYYVFAGSVDDSGNVFLDGTSVLPLVDYREPNVVTVMVAAGPHSVQIVAQNAAGVGSVGVTIETAVTDGGGGGGGGGGYVGGLGQSLLQKKRASGGQNFISNISLPVASILGNDGDLPTAGMSLDYDFKGYHGGSELYEGVSYVYATGSLMAASAYGGGNGGRGGDLVQGTSTGKGQDGARGLVIVKYTKPKVYSDFVFYQQNYKYGFGGLSTYAQAADEARKFVSSTPFVIPGTNYWNHRIFFNTHIYAVPAKSDAYFYEDYVPGLYANLAVASRTSSIRFLVQSQNLVDNTLLPYSILSFANLDALSPNTVVSGNLTIRSNRAFLDMNLVDDGGTSDDFILFTVNGPGCLADANVTVTVKASGEPAGNILYGFSNCNFLTGNIGLPAITGKPVELPNFFSNDSQIRMPEFKVDTASDYARYSYYVTRDSSAPMASRQTHEQEIQDYSYRSSNIKINSWTVGATSVAGYNFNQTMPGENALVQATDPWARVSTVWQSQPSGDGNADGGWNGDYFPIDPNKLYRSSVWVRRVGNTIGGTVYHGLYTNGTHIAYSNSYSSMGNVRRLSDGLAEWNPYWNYRAAGDYIEGLWYLHVGFIFPATHTGNIAHPDSGIYTRQSGLVMSNQGNINDGKFPVNATQAMQRVYHYYCNDNTTRIQFAFPRFEEVTQYTTPINLLLDYGPYEIPQLKNEAPNKYVVARRKTWPVMWNTRGG